MEPRVALAQLHLLSKSYDLAIDEGQKVLKDHPDHVRGHFILGDASLGRGDWPKAREAFTATVRLAPRDPLGYYGLGLVHRREKRDKEALEVLEQALDLNPHFIQALTQIIEIYSARGEGQRALERALQHGKWVPANPSLHNLLGYIYMPRLRLKKPLS
jgi:tetratricopeptide (TPR) repeat protein